MGRGYNDSNPQPTGVHWGTYSATTELPNTSSGVHTSALMPGDVAAVDGELYMCQAITSTGSATWEKLARSGGSIAGALTVGGALTVTGAITPTGGIARSTASRVFNLQPGGTAITGLGTDAVAVAGTVYVSEIELFANKTLTGIGVLNGTNVGTDLIIVSLYNGTTGVRVATSDLAGTLGAGADVYQEVEFTATYAAVAGKYLVSLQVEGTTHANQRLSANTPICFTAAVAGVFGTLPTLTVPTTFTAAQGPIVYVY